MSSIGTIPKDCRISGEHAGVWSGWSSMGDREVVREASAKGTHLELAYKFLMYRRNWTLDVAREYFKTEVDVWVNELLRKRQIHRVTHILNNMKNEPIQYIRSVCLKCTNPDLRDYLFQHVINHAGFSAEQIEAWEILKWIKKYEEQYELKSVLTNGPAENVSVAEIVNVSQSLKSPLLTELYFHIFEPVLVEKLTSDSVWDYLLLHEKTELLVDWIDKRWSNPERSIFTNGHDVTELFARLEISQAMINSIADSNASDPVKELLLNEVSRVGIFCERERENVKLTLARHLSALTTPTEFRRILSQVSCNLDKQNFMQKLHSLVFHQITHEDGDSKQYARDKKLLETIENAATDGRAFRKAIFQTIHYVSDDFNEFLQENPLITWCLILSNCSNNEKQSLNPPKLTDIFSNLDECVIDDVKINPKVIELLLENYYYLDEAVNGSKKSETMSMYQFFHGFKNLDVAELFKWRKKGENVPNFASENLIKKYGHKEKMTFMYYLKEARPGMAAHILQRDGNARTNLSSKLKSKIAFLAHIFGLKYVKNPEIISTCIVFIEYLEVDSECLRFHTTALHYVQKELKVSINDLLQSITYQNPEDLRTVMSHLEHSFQNEHKITSLCNINSFISVLKSWDFIVRFARLHNAALPASFSRQLAKKNLWLEFILVNHIFGYPLEQVLENAEEFEDRNIREHVLTLLTNFHLVPSVQSTHRDKKKTRNSARIPTSNHVASESLTMNRRCSAFDQDLWVVILKCHQNQDPPGALLKASRERNCPMLTVLAACYEPSSVASYCYSWLIISIEDEKVAANYSDCLEDQIWPTRRISSLLQDVVFLGHIDILRRGFQIFLPKNPLTAFFEFLERCLKYGEFQVSSKRLVDFTNACSSLRSNRMIDWDDTDAMCLSNEYWIATVAVKCILTALETCLHSTHLQETLLQILLDNNFNVALNIDGPDFGILLNIVRSLASTNTRINFSAIELNEEGLTLSDEIQRCIRALTDNKDFNTALKLSNIVGLPCSTIIIDRCRSEFQEYAKKGANDATFWTKCAADIRAYNVSFESAAEFFVEHAERVSSYKERYEILELALKTLQPASEMTDRQIIDTVEMAMWKSCMLAGPEAIDMPSVPRAFNKLKFELLCGISNLRVSCILNDSLEEQAVEALIDRVIDAEDLETALRISAIFNFKHHDLKILMLCLSIAEGEVSPYDLSIQQKLLLIEPTRKPQKQPVRSRMLQKRHSESSLTIKKGEIDCTDANQLQQDSIILLERLIKNLRHGYSVGNKILLLYRLSTRLDRSYPALLLSSNPMAILYEITESSFPRKINVIGDVIATYCMKSVAVSRFLAGEVILHVTRQVKDDEDCPTMWGSPVNTVLQQIVELCSDPSLLGWELLKSANLQLGHSLGGKRDVLTLKIVIELLIRAHDYFTTACSMEGIVVVLRKCRNLANTLQHLKLWSLLVRLVTGVGRFTEMNYIFQIFKENDQFEFLLGKGMDKVPGLKTALLEFCKKQCPADKDLFNLVTLHFQLYNEIGIKWENEAKLMIRELIKKSRKENVKTGGMQSTIKLRRSDKIEESLQLAIANFTHATDYFLQDNKLNLANRCVRQAQLVALQLALVNGVSQNQEVICLLDLTPEEVNKVICQNLTFSQTLILIEAYNHNADWSNVLYYYLILNGQTRFLKDFLAYRQLTPAIVQDCAFRYRTEKNISKQMTVSMKSLIAELHDIECKYVLASQLGFKDIIEIMLSNPTTGAYLKDTVWKKGFNPQEFIGESFRS